MAKLMTQTLRVSLTGEDCSSIFNILMAAYTTGIVQLLFLEGDEGGIIMVPLPANCYDRLRFLAYWPKPTSHLTLIRPHPANHHNGRA